MLARSGTSIPTEAGWTFEPKYDGVRVLAYVVSDSVRLVTRNGKDKSAQFPEITADLARLGVQHRRPLVLDGEIVALADGKPARFQALQSRVHLTDVRAIETLARRAPAALMAFDLLRDGSETLLARPWSDRRQRLELRLRHRTTPYLRLGETDPGDGAEMLRKALADGWEGIIAKRTDAAYRPGVRSDAWIKIKIEAQQEFVVGGFTEPRGSREYFGALLVGYYEGGRLVYAGHVGGGFDHATLKSLYGRLTRIERKTAPFAAAPRTNERAHWVRPELVVEIKFTEWTADGRLRQPIFVGLRDDKDARDVTRQP